MEPVLETLVSFGIKRLDAQLYIFLAQAGPLKGRDIAGALKLYKQQLYRSLKSLKCKGCVEATLERPARFSAVPLEKVLDQFMKDKMEQATALQASKEELLSTWYSMIEKVLYTARNAPAFNAPSAKTNNHTRTEQ